MSKYEKDKIVSGCVTGIESYGVFVSLDEYYSGLIHISEISNGFVRNINDYVNIGETIKVKIVDVDDVNYHLKLTIKDIDYREERKNRQKIVETGLGFKPLSDMLNIWIQEKRDEMLKK